MSCLAEERPRMSMSHLLLKHMFVTWVQQLVLQKIVEPINFAEWELCRLKTG